MNRAVVLTVILLLILLFPEVALAQDYSIDAASPEPLSGADIQESPGGAAVYPAANLGLAAGVDVDGISDGIDVANVGCVIPPNGDGGVRSWYYSVERGTPGLGGVVTAEFNANGTGGDKFRLDLTCLIPPGLDFFSPPILQCDAPDCGLTATPGESSIDALDYGSIGGGVPALPLLALRAANPYGVYLSVSNATAPGGFTGCDVLYQGAPGLGAAAPVLFADCVADLGLQVGDEIDALAVFNVGNGNPLGVGSLIWVSLAAGSPSLGPFGPGDLVQVYPGANIIAIPAAQFDLGPGDDLKGLTVIDPGDPQGQVQDTFLVYSAAGIPASSELFTWCDTPPCNVDAPLSCATDPFDGPVAAPEGGNALLARTNVWGGWGIFPQGYEFDLSSFQGGDVRFWIKTPDSAIGPWGFKVEFQCNPDPVAFPGGITYGTSLAASSWDGTSNWQEIVIPISSYTTTASGAPNPADAGCLATVKSPYLGTIENLPFFSTYWIDYVRWAKQTPQAGASSVTVQGRQLMVDGEPFVVNGVAYAPISVGEDWAGAWRDRPDRYIVDFPLIKASGFNTVRLYAPVLSTAMLDAAWAEGLYVIPQFGVDQNQLNCAEAKNFMIDRFVEMVNAWKDHPAILFWLVGNEVNVNLGGNDLCTDWYPTLDAMAAAAHAAEGASFHPIATANADVTGLADVCQPGCSDDTALPNVDLWGIQVYRGCSLSSVFADYQAKSDCARPVVVTEFGVDAWDSVLATESETVQANCIAQQLVDAEQALAVRTPGGVSSGQVVFEWLDEWWKAECDPGTSWTAQDTCNSSTNGAYPDPGINEEWWGLVSQDAVDPGLRTTREASDIVGESFALGPVCTQDVVSYDDVSGNTDISFDPAAGSADHTLYYGPLSAVSTYGYSGSLSGLGATGSSTVTLPAGSLFWVIAPRNVEEGCYGKNSSGVERPCFPTTGSCNVSQATNRTCECTIP